MVLRELGQVDRALHGGAARLGGGVAAGGERGGELAQEGVHAARDIAHWAV
jgi:hypothetical protein